MCVRGVRDAHRDADLGGVCVDGLEIGGPFGLVRGATVPRRATGLAADVRAARVRIDDHVVREALIRAQRSERNSRAYIAA